jgi:potassium efflux system protein
MAEFTISGFPPPMPRLVLFFALLIGAMAALAPPTPGLAQTIAREESQKLEAARVVVTRIEGEQDAQAESFNGLLALRDQLEPARDDLVDVVASLQQRLNGVQARLAELGSAAPAANATAEAPQNARELQALQAQATEIGAQLRVARALLVQAEQLWDELTNARRDLFNSRVFERQGSLFSPGFWQRAATQGWPDFGRRIDDQLTEINDELTQQKAWPSLFGLLALALTLSIAIRAWRRRMARRPRPAFVDAQSKGALIRHAAIDLAAHVGPFVVLGMVVLAMVRGLDIGTEELETFLLGLAGAALAYGLGNSAVRAVFSPEFPQFRLVRADDAVAARAVRVVDAMLAVYLVGLIALGAVQLVSGHLSLTITITGLMALAVVCVGMFMLIGAPGPGDGAAAVGLFPAPLHLLRPLFWLLTLVIVGALAAGYIALAGFIVGRTLATAVILCLAILIYVAIDAILHDAIAPGRPANTRVSAMFGVRPENIDLIGTIFAGALRLVTVVFTVLVLLSPWGIEFGNLNPFEDVFFGLRFSDLRGWIGAAGIALILFTAGLVSTRLFVGWLQNQLLPRTTLNTGARHSIATIAGYFGVLIALTIALHQAGVQLQNIALVASALSVGIGFGLQQIVSNFVAGLIVLAERPIRVGDVIVVKGEEGTVKKIKVRATELSLGENSTVIVPNADIVSSIVKNRSFNDFQHRASIKLIVTHDSDFTQALSILIAIANAHPDVVKGTAPAAYVVKVSDVGIELDLNVICDRIGKIDRVRSDLYVAALSKFRAAGIRLAVAGTAAAAVAQPPRAKDFD